MHSAGTGPGQHKEDTVTNQRAARFVLKPTKIARDAQTSRESKARLRRFALRRGFRSSAQQTVQWADNLLKEATQ
jgi:hypothetical protein